MLSKEKRQSIAARAANFLRMDTVTWVQGNWIIVGDKSSDVNRTGFMRDVRYRIKNIGAGNSCSVCLEGALLMSMAQDSEINDNWAARYLLAEFYDDVRQLDLSSWDVSDEMVDIPELNDRYLGNKYDAIEILERIANN